MEGSWFNFYEQILYVKMQNFEITPAKEFWETIPEEFQTCWTWDSFWPYPPPIDQICPSEVGASTSVVLHAIGVFSFYLGMWVSWDRLSL